MKHTSLWIALLSLWAGSVSAVDFNIEAMKKMQQQGHQILAEKQGQRMFRLPNGQCLQVGGALDRVGAILVSRKCNDKAASQKWYFDDEERLVSQGNTCVGIAGGQSKAGSKAVMQQCGDDDTQKWQHDDAERLVNASGLCLQANAENNVVVETCGNAPMQKWN